MNFDGALYRATVNLGALVTDTDGDDAVHAAALAVAFLPANTIPHVQVNTKDAKVRVAYTTGSRQAVAAAIARAEAEVLTAGGDGADVFAILTAPGEKAAFIAWSLGEIPAFANKSDFFEAAVSAVLFYCDTTGVAVIDRTAFATVIQ